jgi:hypothetical protein
MPSEPNAGQESLPHLAVSTYMVALSNDAPA